MSSLIGKHRETLIPVVKYLKKTPGKGIVYMDQRHVRVEAFSNVD